MSWMSKLSSQISDIFIKKPLDEDMLEELSDVLIMADVGVDTSFIIIEELRKARFNKEVSPEEAKSFLAGRIAETVRPAERLFAPDTSSPYVVLLAGVNGSGKTTVIGKLSHQLVKAGKSVGIVAADTFRAAAIEQLKTWAERSRSSFYAKHEGADAASVVYEALSKAKEDVLLIDTAGRLQNRKELLEELQKIVRTAKKIIPDAPHLALLTLDATVGQNALSQVQVFDEAISVDGLIVNKLDGSAKAGVLVALTRTFEKPIYFAGMGEGIDDLKPFSADEYASNLIGRVK